MHNFKINNSNSITFLNNDQSVYSRNEIWIVDYSGKRYNFPIIVNENRITSDLGKFGEYSEELTLNKNYIIGKIKLKVKSDLGFVVQCPCEYPKSSEIPYFMIPGFLYGTNNMATSDGMQPKFNYGGEVGFPNSSKFYLRSDRSSNSSVIRIADGICTMIGLEHVVKNAKIVQKDKWSPAHLFTGLMLDSSKPDCDITGFQIGYENAPYRYSWRKEEEVPKENEKLFGFIEDQKDNELQIKTVYSANNSSSNLGYGRAIEEYYNIYHDSPIRVGRRKNAIEDIADSLIERGYNKEKKFFSLTDQKDAEDRDGSQLGNIAWTGGMQAAFPLMKAGHYLKNEKYIKISSEFIDNICENAVNQKAHLLNEENRDGIWQITGWWGTREDCFNFGDNPLHSAYLNGQCSYYLLKSFILCNKNKVKWREISRMILDTAIRNQKSDGAFGIFYNPEDGMAVDYDGFQGCWFVPGLALMYKLTSEGRYLEAAEKGIDHYYKWHKRGELYNTPMDTHRAVDQEGNLAFIASCRELHEITQDEKYIEYGLAGLHWEFSWKFSYNKVFSNNPLRDLNWSSSGGSITSTHNPSIHQMGNLVAGDIYYFYEQTKNEYIKERLHDTCIWGLNAYNVYDGYLGFGRKGEATEQFTYTDGVVLPWPHPWDGGIWEANLPWAAACILLSCAEDIPNDLFEMGNE